MRKNPNCFASLLNFSLSSGGQQSSCAAGATGASSIAGMGGAGIGARSIVAAWDDSSAHASLGCASGWHVLYPDPWMRVTLGGGSPSFPTPRDHQGLSLIGKNPLSFSGDLGRDIVSKVISLATHQGQLGAADSSSRCVSPLSQSPCSHPLVFLQCSFCFLSPSETGMIAQSPGRLVLWVD